MNQANSRNSCGIPHFSREIKTGCTSLVPEEIRFLHHLAYGIPSIQTKNCWNRIDLHSSMHEKAISAYLTKLELIELVCLCSYTVSVVEDFHHRPSIHPYYYPKKIQHIDPASVKKPLIAQYIFPSHSTLSVYNPFSLKSWRDLTM